MKPELLLGSIAVVAAILLLVQGIAALGESTWEAVLMFTGATVLLLIFNFIRTSVHEVFTVRQFVWVKNQFPDEIQKNRRRTILWITIAMAAAVLLLCYGTVIFGERRIPAFTMIIGAIVMSVLAAYLCANGRKVFTMKQLMMLRASVHEYVGTVQLLSFA